MNLFYVIFLFLLLFVFFDILADVYREHANESCYKNESCYTSYYIFHRPLTREAAAQ